MFRRYPQLRSSLPIVPFGTPPSPVRRLVSLERHVGQGEIWLKNDGLFGTIYGGNKTRKLEFILADALQRRVSTVITFGGLGSHHCLATALYARQVGLRSSVVLADQPMTEDVRENLRRLEESGARLHHAGSPARAVFLTPWLALRCARWRRPRLPYVIRPGGSTALGSVGYVNAALELAEQVRLGDLPAPRCIFVPLGSNGTAAGLLLGLRLAGLDTRLVAVRVSDYPTVGARGVARLANGTARLLRSRGADVPAPHFRSRNLTVIDGFVGGGYGHPTPEAEAASVLLEESEGLRLDLTYTAKTVAALLALIRQHAISEGPILYWHTLNALSPGGE
ncbi:MAG: pyridoxal-phosphate dependent enzyme [Dehalococcoidia bacterium]|nr:pyridoxal-phosphate dependent enzyme [Dehalococcoidia bacterium]